MVDKLNKILLVWFVIGFVFFMIYLQLGLNDIICKSWSESNKYACRDTVIISVGLMMLPMIILIARSELRKFLNSL